MATESDDRPTVPNSTSKMAIKKIPQITNYLIEDSSQLPNLPQEIIIDILIRLPVKSLLKFRCVSKSWRSLISDPIFVENHLQMTTTRDDNYTTNHRIIISCEDPVFNFKSFSLNQVFDEVNFSPMELDYPFENPFQSEDVVVVGSCNGLLCIVIGIYKGNVYLWNPTTRKSRRLPDSGLRVRKEGYITYGFGYDCSTDDYKVVAVAVFGCSGSEIDTEKNVEVYSLRTNTWRRIDNFPNGIPLEEPGVFVGGALNWPVVLSSYLDREIENVNIVIDLPFSWGSNTIVALDLATETYRELPKPVHEYEYDLSLRLLGGNLCLLTRYNGMRLDLLVMKEYGVGESWTRLITFRERMLSCIPLYHSENGEILLESRSSLTLYNPKYNTSKFLFYGSSGLCLNSTMYVESLVSPNAEDMVERHCQ